MGTYLFSWYRALQRANRANNKLNLIFFYHVHKAGGTSMCSLAKTNVQTSSSSECLPPERKFCFLRDATRQNQMEWREEVYPIEMVRVIYN